MSGFFDIEATTLAKARAMTDALFDKEIKDCRNADDRAFMRAQRDLSQASVHMRIERLRQMNDGVDRSIVMSAAAITLGSMYAELCRNAGLREAPHISHYFNKGFSAGLGVSDDADIVQDQFAVEKTAGGHA